MSSKFISLLYTEICYIKYMHENLLISFLKTNYSVFNWVYNNHGSSLYGDDPQNWPVSCIFNEIRIEISPAPQHTLAYSPNFGHLNISIYNTLGEVIYYGYDLENVYPHSLMKSIATNIENKTVWPHCNTVKKINDFLYSLINRAEV